MVEIPRMENRRGLFRGEISQRHQLKGGRLRGGSCFNHGNVYWIHLGSKVRICPFSKHLEYNFGPITILDKFD